MQLTAIHHIAIDVLDSVAACLLLLDKPEEGIQKFKELLLGGEEARDKKEKKRRANNASPFTNLTYGVDGCNEPMFRIGYNTPLYTYTDERSAKAEP